MTAISDQAPVKKVARISAHSGRESALKDALRILETATREESGCVEFTFFQAISDPASFILLEQFTNSDAFDAHMQMPHTQAFFKTQLVAAVRAVDAPSI